MRIASAMLLMGALSVAGCATDGLNEAMGIGAVSSAKSTFDNATVVSMTPALLADGTMAFGSNKSVKMGARWSSSSPDSAALLLFRENFAGLDGPAFVNIQGLDVNVDGKIQSFDVSGITDHNVGSVSAGVAANTSSQNTVIVPLALLQTMTTAPDVRLRVRTDKGVEDSIFSIEKGVGGGDTAIVSMRKFLASIATAQAAKKP